MADINVNNNYTDMKNLTPFKLCVLQNFPFIEANFDAVTNYQLLCKVVEYLNKVIDNNNNQNNNISQLEQNFITLYNYVKDYFDNLDVQEEINNKLDNMASDGSLSKLIQPLFDEYKTIINNEVNAQNDKINAQNDKINAQNDKIVVLKNRMDTFTSLPSGSTTDDAELIDIRVPASGFNYNKTYSTAGEAVRGQVSALKGDLSNLSSDIYEYYDIPFKVKNGYYNDTTFVDSPNFKSTIIECAEGEYYSVTSFLRGAAGLPLLTFANDSGVISKSPYITEDTTFTDYVFSIPSGCTYFILQGANTDTFGVKKSYSTIDKIIEDNYIVRPIEIEKKDGYYSDIGGIATFNSSSTNFVSTVIDVDYIDVYFISLYETGASLMPIYFLCDDNFKILGKGTVYSVDTQITDYKVTIPKSVTKLVLTGSALNGRTIEVKKYMSYGQALKKMNEIKPLADLKFIAFGDSITATASRWRTEFIEKTGATEIACYAVGGAHLCDYSDTVLDGNPTGSTSSNTICNQVYQMLLNPPTEIPDFIIISAGTNDNVTPIETLENRNLPNFQNDVGEYRSGKTFVDIDSVDRTAWDGAMRWQAEKIWSVYPNAKIIFIAPIQSADFNTRPVWSILSKGKLMEYISNNMGCVTLQAGAESGIWARFETDGAEGKYLADGLHPNVEGGKVLGRYIASKIINMYSCYSTMVN